MISLPSPPKIIKRKGEQVIFEIEALWPGYGITIGNCLRRILLSSLVGASITQVKIKGVQHEFSTIPGILEDVVSITLNLKQLRFKMYTDEPQKARLLVKGEKDVTGFDFKLPPQLELVNKNFLIATLTDKKAELEMEIQIEKGIGYRPVEESKKERLGIGVIAIDAIFTPIKRVNYWVENMRVGKRTDFDRLFLEFETDGTIEAEEAFSQATEILQKHFSLLGEGFKKEPKLPKKSSPGKQDIVKIEELKLSARTLGALLKNNIKTVEEILKKDEAAILKIKGMGEKGAKEIKKELKKLGF